MNANISAQKAAAAPLDAAQLVGLTPNELWSIPSADIQGLQLAGLRERFDQRVTRIPALGRLASEQKIGRISQLDDAAPLLFRHNVYKSYPLSFLEKSDFTRLTRWLDGLTAFDLSQLDPSKCESIDEGIQFLDLNTEIRVIHSSGTSGKLSFLPRSEGEFAQLHLKWQHHFFEGFGEEGEHVVEGIEGLPVITPSYRFGALGQQRMIEHIAKYWHRGHAVPVIALHPTRMSADALSLGGRLLADEAKGELGQLQLSPKLLARRDEFLAESKDRPAPGRARHTARACRAVLRSGGRRQQAGHESYVRRRQPHLHGRRQQEPGAGRRLGENAVRFSRQTGARRIRNVGNHGRDS